MIAFMPSESPNSSPGSSYWYGGSSLPNALEGLTPDGGRLLRRASEAVIHSHSFHSQEPNSWEGSRASIHLDTSVAASLALRAQPASAIVGHKAPLAPKQGLGGTLASQRAQHQSPISGTYALRTPRGKITSIACESCRKRKSKCDGVRPKCNTCQTKNLICVYDVAEDGKTTTQLRAHVRRLAKELDDMKSVVSLLTMAPDRATAASWATELEKNGFAHHSAEEIKKSLQDTPEQQTQLQEQESLSTPASEGLRRPSHSLTASSYDGSSREDRSREQSQPVFGGFNPGAMDGTAPFNINEATDIGKFSFDCAFYRRTKREMLSNGWDHVQIFGRSEIDVDSILLGFMDPQEGQSVPTWASRIVNKLLPAVPIPTRLASTYLLTKMMRWLIWPSVANLNSMPDWLMPLAQQDCGPYDILIDLLPWPPLRQYLYQHPGEFVVGAFVGFVGTNWPYADDACHYWDMEAGCTKLSPLFENHISDLDNWTLDAKAVELMPQIGDFIPMKALKV
ncbi:hypothetical protein BU24DRAFT_422676 [Aaosphaeria arxii CBS 175.79]|uniref:Zn(2)-C6 fungal-type domain-containing protein n=1 Tax=Aaosphaeria arxii CBS 175.79 TaxID=1450172 RepID=A0A6A5XUE8_9PLEO|nr:uncharacterized protein BU24DRAFT_422676 [Aaosphaeria arxii CBS 175.79]KAF2016331.1 hypothetical protein BU24DRAFT_422676 [Aaosphaeria arxii CBS 175.79]